MEVDLTSLLVVATVSALAPLIADVPRRVRVVVVVVEIVLGILIGPDVLGLADGGVIIEFLSDMGLAILFFMAGAEIDLHAIRGRPLRLGAAGWLMSLAIAAAAAALLLAAGVIDDAEVVAIALATTALGVLAPLLRDAGLRDTPFGHMAQAAGSAGEVGPIILIAIFLAVGESTLTETLLLAVFVAATLVLAVTAPRIRSPRISRVIDETMHASGQLAVRICLLLLVALVFLAVELNLELVLGAFAAGIILGLVTRGAPGADVLQVKLDAIGFGLLIPIFFIYSGMTFDLDGLIESPSALAQLPLFLVLFLVVRGAPALILSRWLPSGSALPMGFLTAATLPLVVAVTQEGVAQGELAPDTAAALVGAAMLSVLIYPTVALALLGRSAPRGPDPEPERL